MAQSKNKALTLADRNAIEQAISNGSTKTAIAQTRGKDKSTIGKEIKLHRYVASRMKLPLECKNYQKCKWGRHCTKSCPGFEQFYCSRRDRSPGACNGCASWSKCHFTKYKYDALRAENEYRKLLVESRAGVNLTDEEAARMAAIIKPELAMGHSPYQIIQDHPELGISEKTLYNYIECKAFSVIGIDNISLRRKVSRKIPKKLVDNYKKREDRSFLKGRLYTDYQAYMEEAPTASVVEMDTVYNDGTNGPFMQTFKFISFDLLIAIYHKHKTAQDMVDGVNLLDETLGHDLFNKLFEVLLTDRGSEFYSADAIEQREDGTLRTRVFYCDPMRSGQKGSLEVNHEQLRYILPKGKDLASLGLVSQEALNFAISNIASTPVPFLQGKTPIQYTKFMMPELWEKLQAFGLQEIPSTQTNLTVSCLQSFIPEAKNV